MDNELSFMPSSIGSKKKINVFAELGNGLHLSDVNFRVRIFTQTRHADYQKDELIKVDDDNYLCKVDTTKLGAGEYWVKLYVDMPDADFEDGIRPEVLTFPSGLKMMP